jgi:hypothetical protein
MIDGSSCVYLKKYSVNAKSQVFGERKLLALACPIKKSSFEFWLKGFDAPPSFRRLVNQSL